MACREGVPGVWGIADDLERALDELEEAARKKQKEQSEELAEIAHEDVLAV